MTIAVCGICNVEMIPLPLGIHSDKAEKFQCPSCDRIVVWGHPEPFDDSGNPHEDTKANRE